jgi:hypothetical protein
MSTAYLCLQQVGPHSKNDVVTDASLLDPGIWLPMEKSVVMGRLLSLGAVRLATTDEVTQAGASVVPLAVSMPLKTVDGTFPFGF